MSAQQWIDRLQLQPHPEGGWFAESFRDIRRIEDGKYSASTAIYFLLEAGIPSHLHKIGASELWHFYAGAPLLVHQLCEKDGYVTHRVGESWEDGARFQAVVPPHVWFGAETLGEFSLVGCTVAPGFEFSEFTLGTREELCRLFPDHVDIVRRLTRN